jgi:mxaJ protein
MRQTSISNMNISLQIAILTAALAGAASPLKFCLDPNNLPFSNNRGEGFENQIAKLVAGELKRPVEYVWWAQRRGFVRNALTAGLCDVVPGIPTAMDSLLATRPYYRSSYVFVSRTATPPRDFDNPILRRLRIGVQIVGDDYANTPPAHALSKRGIVNVQGYRVAGNYNEPNAPARIIDALANGDIDLAIAWGPLAGYFAKRQPIPLYVSAITGESQLPLSYDIGMGVRKRDTELKRAVDGGLERTRHKIAKILKDFNVPYQ